jgi:ATP-dependent RNA helicase DDX3X
MSDAGSNAGLDEAGLARKAQLAEDLARAKAAGWADPIPFNYEATVPGDAGPDESRDTVAWLSDAAIYAWDDDFGDVGAPNPELEKMLFADQYMQRAGTQIKNIAAKFEVNVMGPEKILPVREVSCSFFFSR